METIISLAHLPDTAAGPGYDGVLELARAAEAAGAHGVSLTDHVLLGENLDSHAALGGPFPWPSDHPYPDPLIVLSAVAAVTEEVIITTGVLIAPLRPAGLLAKMAATLDTVSRGRLRLGLGSGWQREEFDALGIGFADRVQRTDDAAAVCRALWDSDGPVTLERPTVTLDQMTCRPQPHHRRRLPIWFAGGANRAVARRVAQLGDGWLPLDGGDLAALARGRELIDDACADVDRDPSTTGIGVMLGDVTSASADEIAERVGRLTEVGVTSASVSLAAQPRFAGDPTEAIHEIVGRVGSP